MNILLAGRLGRYAERILTLRDLGHQLVYCTLAPTKQRPLPDDLGDDAIPRYVLDRRTASETARRIVADHDIDVVYSMKNVWDGSLELVTAMLDAGVGPIIRHYKEHFCQPSEAERRSLTETAAQIYINEASLDYFRRVYDVPLDTAHVLDTDFLPARYVTDELAPKLRHADGRPHLLVAGGVSATGGRNDVRLLCAAMARHRIHVHIHGAKFVGPDAEGTWRVGDRTAHDAYRALTETGYVHLHDHVDPPEFTRTFSAYDAGLMHVTASGTHDAAFQPLNRPNRLAAYSAAGLPLAQQSGGHDAMERLVEETGIGFLYRDHDELASILEDRERFAALTAVALRRRHELTYEANAPALVTVLAGHCRRR